MTQRWNDAVQAVDQWLSRWSETTRLGQEAARLYPKRKVVDGWRVTIALPSSRRRFDILVDRGFPFSAPISALVDRPPHLTWPHLENDGYLCALPNSTAVDSTNPVATLQRVMAEAVSLVATCETGSNVEDFRTEFLSYWPATPDAPHFWSLLTPTGPSRSIAVFQHSDLALVAEDASTLDLWLKNIRPGLQRRPRDIRPAFLLWQEQPMLPSEYPASSTDLTNRLRTDGLEANLASLSHGDLQRLVVVMGCRTDNGPAFAATLLHPRPQAKYGAGRQAKDIESGFRPGHAPPAILTQRLPQLARLKKAHVERIDAAWVHGRDGDVDLPRLRTATVTIVGCGSLGAPVALSLAQAGVGTLHLIDPDSVASANIGRHPLGIASVGLAKVKALQARITNYYPHIRGVHVSAGDWQSVAEQQPELLTQAQLIISTIGAWHAEGPLNSWRLDQSRRPDLLYGWMEPHAVAGHAVGLVNDAGCLACGLTAHGAHRLPVTEWPNGTSFRGEPACGVTYQPYGPVEIGHISAILSEAAIDILLGRVSEPFHRVWTARAALIDRSGAVWSEAWSAANDGAPRYGCVTERAWPTTAECPVCHGGVSCLPSA